MSDLKVLKVKTAVLGLSLRFFLPIKGRGSKYGSLLLILLILKNHTSETNPESACGCQHSKCQGLSWVPWGLQVQICDLKLHSVLRAKTEYLNQECGALPGSFSIMRYGLCVVRNESGGCCQYSKYCGVLFAEHGLLSPKNASCLVWTVASFASSLRSVLSLGNYSTDVEVAPGPGTETSRVKIGKIGATAETSPAACFACSLPDRKQSSSIARMGMGAKHRQNFSKCNYLLFFFF